MATLTTVQRGTYWKQQFMGRLPITTLEWHVSVTDLRVCNKCGRAVPADWIRAGRQTGVCRECRRVQGRVWRSQNPDKARSYSRKWRAANLDFAREIDRRHYHENKAAIAARIDKKRRRVVGRANAFKRRYGEAVTPEAYDMLIVVDGDPCAYCGAGATTVDHVSPVDGNAWNNFAAACNQCNVRKGDRGLLWFLLDRRIRAEQDALRTQLRRVA